MARHREADRQVNNLMDETWRRKPSSNLSRNDGNAPRRGLGSRVGALARFVERDVVARVIEADTRERDR